MALFGSDSTPDIYRGVGLVVRELLLPKQARLRRQRSVVTGALHNLVGRTAFYLVGAETRAFKKDLGQGEVPDADL